MQKAARREVPREGKGEKGCKARGERGVWWEPNYLILSKNKMMPPFFRFFD